MATRAKNRSNAKRGIADVEAETSKYFAESANEKLTTDEITINSERSHESKRTRKGRTEKPKTNETEPKNWQIILENIRKMRSNKDAVVDDMGAEKTFDQNEGNPKNKRFQVLVSLMLSSQTRDQITYKIIQSLREFGLTVDKIIETNEEQLKELIHSVSFYNVKAKNIKKVAQILHDQYDGDIPDSLDGLLALPGVGPKMAHLAMLIAWDQCTGIAVDTHVHRICNRLKWADSKHPEHTQKQLELWLPKHLWREINLLLVGFGQTICSPVRPKCKQCLNQKICPYASHLEF